MGTVVFDFDSTLVPCESLAEALARAPGVDAAARREIDEITRAGMEGAISFHESLTARLALARPTRAAVTALGAELAGRLSRGARELVADLHARGHEVWIVSGAFVETLLPAARALRVPETRVIGLRAQWAPGGAFEGLAPDDPSAHAKEDAVRGVAARWPRPVVGVGDGATDLALRDAGFVEHFVAYCEHARRPPVVDARGVHVAADMDEAARILGRLLP